MPFYRSAFRSLPVVLALFALACHRDEKIPEITPPVSPRPTPTSEKPTSIAATPTPAPLANASNSSISPEKPAPAAQKFKEIPAEERDKLGGLISFISERDGQREVYLVQANGSKEKRFTDNKFADYNGPFSPDGKALVVMRVEGEEGPHKLYYWPLDGAEPKRLGPETSRLRFPNFTPDGKFIYFESSGSKESPAHFCDIFRVDIGGKKFEKLTNNDEGNFEPAVSPRGDVVMHISSRDRVAELYAMKLDGKSPLRLTNTPRDEWGGKFSPDGSKIAFISDREGAERIWLKDFPDGPEKRLTQRSPASRIVEDKITWAPSGKTIAYVLAIPDTPSAVVLFDLETGKEITLRGPVGSTNDPSWSSDGKHLAVTVTQGKEQQIWIVRADGTAWMKLTTSSGGNWNPIWSPQRHKK